MGPSAPTTPNAARTVRPGRPTATSRCPTRRSPGAAHGMGARPVACARRTATSVLGSRPTRDAWTVSPLGRPTWMPSSHSITWSAVTMTPSGTHTTPLPARRLASTRTTLVPTASTSAARSSERVCTEFIGQPPPPPSIRARWRRGTPPLGGRDPGNRRRNGDLDEDLPLGRAHDAEDVPELDVHPFDPGVGAEKGQKENHDHDEDHLRVGPDPEPDDEQGGEGDPGDPIEGHDIGVQHLGEDLPPAQEEPAPDPRHRADEEPGDRLIQRHREVPEDGAVPDHLPEVGEDPGRAGDPERVDDPPGDKFPHREEQHAEAGAV